MNERTRRRGGGHAGHARDTAAQAIRQMPWRIPLNPDRPTEPLPPEGVAAIHDAAMRVLEETGIDFLNAEARDILAAAGCPVDGDDRADGPRLRHGAGGEGAGALRHHSAQPRAPGDDGRRPHVLRQRLLAAELHGPRPRPPGRRLRRVPRLHQAHPVLQLHPRRRRLPGRAGRHPRRGPPPRLPLREADADRQGRARLQPRPRAGRGRDRDGPHRQRPRPRGVREQAPPLHQHQLLEPAQARLADARWRDALRPPRPAGDRDPLHARRRDGAGHDGRRRRAVDRRGARGHRAPAGDPPRRRLHDRHLHLQRRHEVRRPGLRHPRIRPRHPDDRPDGPLLRPALARLERLRLQRAGRPGDVGEPDEPLVGGAVGGQSGLPCRRMARRRIDRLLREVRDGLRGAAAVPALFRARAHRHLARAPSPSTPSPMSGRTGISLAPTTRKAVTHQPSTRRSSATGATTRPGPRRARSPPSSGRTGLEGDPRRVRAAADRRGHPRGARRLHRAAKREGGAPTDF